MTPTRRHSENLDTERGRWWTVRVPPNPDPYLDQLVAEVLGAESEIGTRFGKRLARKTVAELDQLIDEIDGRLAQLGVESPSSWSDRLAAMADAAGERHAGPAIRNVVRNHTTALEAALTPQFSAFGRDYRFRRVTLITADQAVDQLNAMKDEITRPTSGLVFIGPASTHGRSVAATQQAAMRLSGDLPRIIDDAIAFIREHPKLKFGERSQLREKVRDIKKYAIVSPSLDQSDFTAVEREVLRNHRAVMQLCSDRRRVVAARDMRVEILQLGDTPVVAESALIASISGTPLMRARMQLERASQAVEEVAPELASKSFEQLRRDARKLHLEITRIGKAGTLDDLRAWIKNAAIEQGIRDARCAGGAGLDDIADGIESLKVRFDDATTLTAITEIQKTITDVFQRVSGVATIEPTEWKLELVGLGDEYNDWYRSGFENASQKIRMLLSQLSAQLSAVELGGGLDFLSAAEIKSTSDMLNELGQSEPSILSNDFAALARSVVAPVELERTLAAIDVRTAVLGYELEQAAVLERQLQHEADAGLVLPDVPTLDYP